MNLRTHYEKIYPKSELAGDIGIYRSLFSIDYKHFGVDFLFPNEEIKELVKWCLDDEFKLYSQVMAVSSPTSKLHQSKWHREIFYQHLTTSRPLAVQTLVILDDFNERTGGTLILPGSHLFETFPGDEFASLHQMQPELEPGDVLLLNSFLYHRSGVNKELIDRTLITNTFVRPFMDAQFDYTRMVNSDLDDFEREIFSFRWNSHHTLQEWFDEKTIGTEGPRFLR